MIPFRTTASTISTLAVLCCLTAISRGADDLVSVKLVGGRTITGTVDWQTDDTSLWLHDTAPGMILRSAIDWTDIAQVRHAGKVISANDFRTLAPTLRTKAPPVVLSQKISGLPPAPSNATEPRRIRIPDQPRWPRTPVQSLSLYAVVANWDSDVEPDGLQVTVYPLDAAGEVAPVSGRLEITLVGETQSGPVEDRFRKRVPFPELGRWSVPVRESDVAASGAVYRVPFRNFHPEWDLDIAADALLTARLIVPGLGSFDASDANVNLRPHSSIRDALQLRTHGRFFPEESVRRFHP